jgi:uncharacterized membrane protein YphA (DoxX/SURF4 family)
MTQLPRLLALLLRSFIGLVLVATAIGKGLDLRGFTEVIGTYDLLPSLLHWPVAIGMTTTELVLGAVLLSGRRTAQAALVSALLHASFTAWASVALLRGLHLDNCGCFGVFLARPLTWATVVEDSAMVGFSLALYALTRARRTAVAPAE